MRASFGLKRNDVVLCAVILVSVTRTVLSAPRVSHVSLRVLLRKVASLVKCGSDSSEGIVGQLHLARFIFNVSCRRTYLKIAVVF